MKKLLLSLLLLPLCPTSLAMQPDGQAQIVLPTDCSICQEPLNRERTVTLPCHATHIFHRSCIRSWTLHNPSCPLDRQRIPLDVFNIQLTPQQEQRFYASIAAEGVLLGTCVRYKLPWSYLFCEIAATLIAHNFLTPAITDSLIAHRRPIGPRTHALLTTAVKYGTIESAMYLNGGMAGIRTYHNAFFNRSLKRVTSYCGAKLIEVANSDYDYEIEKNNPERKGMIGVTKLAGMAAGFFILSPLLEKKFEMATELLVSQGSKLLTQASEKLCK